MSASISTSSRWSGCCIGILRESRQWSCSARPAAVSPKVDAGNKQNREDEVADERVSEEHPSRRRAVLRQTDCDRLNETGEIFDVTGIAQPRKRIGNQIK